MSAPNHPEQISRDYIRLLQVMRRFVMDEFDVSIRMSQEDALTQLLHYADISGNNVLQEMGKELREMTEGVRSDAAEEETAEGDGVRYYRGVAVGGAAPTKTAAAADSKDKNRPARVYRGQVISN